MSSIGASLRECPGLNVVQVNTVFGDAAERLGALDPAAVIFDLAAVRPEFTISFWKAHPHVLLIGVDVVLNEMLVLSGQAARAWRVQDLVQVINTQFQALKK
jgi:hypothetical protein